MEIISLSLRDDQSVKGDTGMIGWHLLIGLSGLGTSFSDLPLGLGLLELSSVTLLGLILDASASGLALVGSKLTL